MTVSGIARHEVNDFDTWKKSYDASAEYIKGMGVIADSVHRDLDDPNMVTVYHQFADVATAKAFTATLNSGDFKAQAAQSGVQLETMTLYLMQDVLPRPVRSHSGTASGIARHEVKDFDAWMEEFKGADATKKALGVIAESVHRDLDNPNMVTVYHQFTDAATARAFAGRVNSDQFQGPATESGNILLETMVVMMMADVG
jgi:quinol monooxygenase YgiN